MSTAMTPMSKRKDSDHYPTPAWCTRTLLDWLRARNFLGMPPALIRDPFAGDGAILRVVREELPGVPLEAIDIQPVNRSELEIVASNVQIGSYFSVSHDVKPGHWTITNPPYSMALEAVQTCITRSSCAAVLLRLGFLASQKRSSFLRSHMPSRVLVLSRRPSFTGGGTDSSDYAWFVWTHGIDGGSPPHSQLELLDCAGGA